MQRALPLSQLPAEPGNDPASWASLPGLCCQAAGGDSSWADELALAWFCFYTAAHLLDNIEDQDELEGELMSSPPGGVTNLATGFIFSAALALDRLHSVHATRPVSAGIPGRFYNGFLTMCSGQHLDLVTPQPSLEQWHRIAAAKSGTFFRLACWGGAAIASDQPEVLETYGDFGFRLGMLIQLLDDLGDLRREAGKEEALLAGDTGRSLPLAYARSVLPQPELQRLQDLLERGSRDETSARQAIERLESCGADLYVLTEIERQAQLGIEALRAAQPAEPARSQLLALMQQLSSRPSK